MDAETRRTRRRIIATDEALICTDEVQFNCLRREIATEDPAIDRRPLDLSLWANSMNEGGGRFADGRPCRVAPSRRSNRFAALLYPPRRSARSADAVGLKR
jgi:hypothetical protein